MKRILSTVASILLCTVAVNAAGTNYNVDITNTATLSFQVGGVTQDISDSNVDTFKVDRKVDVAVASTDGANIVVIPKDNTVADDKPLTFTVTNESNGVQFYTLSALNLASGQDTKDAGEVDNADFTTDLKICIDATCSAGSIDGTSISFNEDETKTYYVFADIDSTANNEDKASIALIATAVTDGTTTPMTDDKSTADQKTVVDIVFAEAAGDAAGDAQYDGKHSALSAYELVTADIDVVKSSCVVSDGITADDAKAKRIPGATVRYAIGINNTGAKDITGAVLEDTLEGTLTYSSSEIRDAACNCATPAGAVIATDTVAYADPVVTANFGTVALGTSECAYIEALIK